MNGFNKMGPMQNQLSPLEQELVFQWSRNWLAVLTHINQKKYTGKGFRVSSENQKKTSLDQIEVPWADDPSKSLKELQEDFIRIDEMLKDLKKWKQENELGTIKRSV